MAGGIGSRFWPISRNARPKQFLDILGTGKSFIRHTFERFAPIVPAENFLVVTNRVYRDLVLEQIPEIKEGQVLCEPVGRNTAPCIAYAAFRLMSVNPEADMIVTPSDHLILNEAEFVHAIDEAMEFVRSHNVLMTIGIRPTRPDTGYGYIQVDGEQDNNTGAIHRVKTFTEKPNIELARAFVESGEFVWNAGIFLWKAAGILEAMRTMLPEMYQQFAAISDCYGTSRESECIERVYSECRSISIDFGVMEKAENVYVRCSDFGWSDIGTWGSLYSYSKKDDHGNVVRGEGMFYDTHDSIVMMPEGKLAVIEGLDDYIVVDSGNVLMICPKKNEQNIKKFIDDAKFHKGERYT